MPVSLVDQIDEQIEAAKNTTNTTARNKLQSQDMMLGHS
jgi:hypothetical protein